MPIPLWLTNRLRNLQDEAARLMTQAELSEDEVKRMELIPAEIEAVKAQIEAARKLEDAVNDSRKLMDVPATPRPFNAKPNEQVQETESVKSSRIEPGEAEFDKLKRTGGFKSLAHLTYTLIQSQRGHADALKTLSRWVNIAASTSKIAFDSEHERQAIKAALGMGITADPTADIFVPMEFAREIYERVEGVDNELIPRVERLPIAGSSIRLPAFDDSDRSRLYRHGGIVAYWEGEGDAAALTKIDRTRYQDFRLKRVTAAVAASDEMLSDSAYPLETIISNKAIEAIRFTINQAIWDGDGSSQPLGVLKSGALVTVAAETGQAAKTVVAANIDKMWTAVTASCRSNGVWFINQELEPQLAALYYSTGATSGQLIYLPPNGISGSPYATLKGRPIIPLEFASAPGDVGDIVFADLSKYRLVMKGETSRDISMHVRFLNHEQLFRFTMRVDGQSLWDAPIKPLKGSTNFRTSCFVTLAAR